MRYRKLIFALLALSLAAALVGCSSSKKVPPAISVALSGTPPASMVERTTAPFTATITNDTSANPQVGWTATCANPDCGSFSALNTASGTATTYTAPALMPAGGVTITATSVTDITQSASATVAITLATTLADGTYVFYVQGDSGVNSGTYVLGGAFTVAGGLITDGEQDFVSFDVATVTDEINATGSMITTTADGNLQIVLTTCTGACASSATPDPVVGVSGVETLNGVIVNGDRALINEFDTFGTASGTLDLQTNNALSTGGGYAFLVTGDPCPASFGGVLNVNGTSSDGNAFADGSGSVFDLNACGSTFPPTPSSGGLPFDGSTVHVIDSLAEPLGLAFGRVEFSLSTLTASQSTGGPSGLTGIGLAGYPIDGNRVRLVENNQDPIDFNFDNEIGGTALFQGANTGAFAAPAAATTYTFAISGLNLNGLNQVAGLVTLQPPVAPATNTGAVAGVLDSNDLSGGVAAQTAFTGTYTIDDATFADGPSGRVTLTGLTDSGATFTFNLQAYLDGNGNATVISMDSLADALAGSAWAQTGGGSFTAASFAGNYGLDATGFDFNFENEFDAVGGVTADGTSALASMGTGSIDQNALIGSPTVATPTAALVLAGTYAADAGGLGTFTDGMTGLDVDTPANADKFSYYLIDTTRVMAIENDTNQLTLGYFELQQ